MAPEQPQVKPILLTITGQSGRSLQPVVHINTHSFDRQRVLLSHTMTTKGKRTSATFCLAVILFVLSLFARTTECFRLRKTERRDRRREAAAGFQPGRILFGNVFEKRSSVDAQARDGAHISPASAEDDANYQGDSPG